MAQDQSVQIKKEGAPPSAMVPGPLMSLRDEIDRLFDDFMQLSPLRGGLLGAPLARLGLRRAALPSADVIERDDGYEIDIDVPGLEKDNIEIAVSDHTLTIRCNVEEVKEEKGKEYYMSERRHETCSRSFPLPQGVDMDKVEADLKNGLLKITLPKTAEAMQKPRRIEVKTQ